MQQTIDQRLKIYSRVETSLNQMFKELSFCKDKCMPQERSFMGNSHKNGPIGCCHDNYYHLNIPSYKKINQETQDDIRARFRELQEENLITKLMKPNSSVKDYLRYSYSSSTKCSCHSSEGCMIEKFKSPTCVSYTCVPLERELEQYNINYDQLIFLDFIGDIFAGEVRSKQAQNLIQRINQATQRIKDSKTNPNQEIQEQIVIDN